MYFGWAPYVSVAQRRRLAERERARLKKAGHTCAPVVAYRGAIAKTYWGKAWCQNLERYSDYANRLPRGRTYVRNGSVIDLTIAAGTVAARVMGSSLYQIQVTITAVPVAHWQGIVRDCARSLDSLVELLQGKFSSAVMERLSRPGTGLFPTPSEIRFTCSCPDSAALCKHVAATLYGIGTRLDAEPELLFALRHVEAKDLLSHVQTSGLPVTKGPRATRVLDPAKLADVFGIDLALADTARATPQVRRHSNNRKPKKKALRKQPKAVLRVDLDRVEPTVPIRGRGRRRLSGAD